MSIFNHYKNLALSTSQQEALLKLEDFITSSAQVFMLKGYAGSGKTAILKGLVEYFNAIQINFSLMAPTGRAAKILKTKTGYGSTIHQAIYDFDRIESINKESDDEAEHSFHYYFPIKRLSNEGHIIVIDESSMISSVESNHELFTFGTNILLNDILTYASLNTTNNKIIFVGDPAQLPPINDARSLGLDELYFENDLGLTVISETLREVHRQQNNLILDNAFILRKLIEKQSKSDLIFQYDNESFIRSNPESFIETYTDNFPLPEIGNGVIISYSNSQCFHYNKAIREKIFPSQLEIVPGDLLLINGNNYHTYGVELFNGDMAKVVEVEEGAVKQSAPVYCDEDGKRVRKVITLEFKKIKIRVPHHPNEISCFIFNNLLHSVDRDLSICEMKAIYINFMIRFNSEQKIRKENGLDTYKVGSEEFKQNLKLDPFFNALKVKFGYAITCHKAQGGEWEKVFIDYYGRVSLKEHPLRWCYTATTRGSEVVYTLNEPHFSSMSKLTFSAIGAIGKIPSEALNFNHCSISPYHKPAQHKCKSAKYWEILEKLETTDFKILNVESFGEYLERYTISDTNECNYILQASHKGSGHFIEKFHTVNSTCPEKSSLIESLFNDAFNQTYSIDYIPSLPFLKVLHSRMAECCDELEINITNITEGKNYINYFLVTSSICSYIQFYYNNNDQLTTAMPKTFNCVDDILLQKLLNKLIDYASQGN